MHPHSNTSSRRSGAGGEAGVTHVDTGTHTTRKVGGKPAARGKESGRGSAGPSPTPLAAAREAWAELRTFEVPVEFKETAAELTATLRLPPGIEKDALRVHVERHALHLQILSPEVRAHSYDLPVAVDGRGVRAALDGATLRLRMRKGEPAEQGR